MGSHLLNLQSATTLDRQISIIELRGQC